MTLYHSVESTCAHKVRLVLAEKQLDWREQLINLRKGEQFHPDYLALNPKAVVPTLIHHRREGDVVLRESTIINEYLDDEFPETCLKPTDNALRALMRLWVKTIDEEIHPATGIMTYGAVLRHQMNELKTPAQLEQHFAAIPDPARRLRQRSIHDKGIESEAFAMAIKRLYAFVGDLEQQLAKSSWLAGDNYSLADAAALPYVMRLDAMQFGFMWRVCPALANWYQSSLSRENAQALVGRNTSPGLEALVRKYGIAAAERVNTILQGVV